MCELAQFLNEFWLKYTQGSDGDDEKKDREKSLMISSIMRIMTILLCKMPFEDLPSDSVRAILGLAFTQANQSIQLA